ncbi:MAG: hypothetical protein [Caudoviricetes sp.]|nr:MAG: hypothetical protein [Caudoviricetes sp.]
MTDVYDDVEKYVKEAVSNNTEMSSSAKYCFDMAIKTRTFTNTTHSMTWLQKAMSYSVGVHHSEYKRLFENEEVIVPELDEGDVITVVPKVWWKLGFSREKGFFSRYLVDCNKKIYGISYVIPECNMANSVFLKDVNVTIEKKGS